MMNFWKIPLIKKVNYEIKKMKFEEIKRIMDVEFERLTEREKAFLIDRYGLCDGKYKSLREVGEKFELSYQRVSQVIEKALRKIRKDYIKNVLPVKYKYDISMLKVTF